jgi:hypothetical protein
VRRLLVVGASLALAGIWGVAAYLKSLDPAAFALQITQHHVTPESWSPFLAGAFVFAEALLALAHLTGFRPRLAFLGSAALLVLFIGVTGIAWAQGNTEGCGCFGRLAARHPREVIVEDIGFVAIAAVGWFAARGMTGFPFSGRLFAALVPIALVLPFAGPHLPGDRFVTTFNVGEDLSNLAADDLPITLGEGRVLLALVADSCPPCVEGLPGLDAIAGTEGAPAVVAVFAGSRKEARAWALEHVPAFGVASAPVSVLRQYYRTLPQAALLEDGRIVRVWRKRLPSPDEVLGPASS